MATLSVKPGVVLSLSLDIDGCAKLSLNVFRHPQAGTWSNTALIDNRKVTFGALDPIAIDAFSPGEGGVVLVRANVTGIDGKSQVKISGKLLQNGLAVDSASDAGVIDNGGYRYMEFRFNLKG